MKTALSSGTYRPRALAPAFRKARRGFPVVLVTGPRQSGKTTFVRHMLPTAAYASLDDPLQRDFARQDPRGFLDQHRGRPLVLDEIQNNPEILTHVKLHVDTDRRPGSFVLTGSQPFHLMRRVGETLAGRIAILELPPFSLAEARAAARTELADLLWRGLFPDPCLHPERRDVWVRSYLQTYVERDIRRLENVQNLAAFETFVRLAAAWHGQEFHASRLASDCGVTRPTVRSWQRLLTASYLGLELPPFFRNLGKRVVKAPRFYFTDPAIVTYLGRLPDAGSALASSLGGPLFEGLIVAEAWKAFLAAGRAPDLFHWRSNDGLEVDLLVQARGKVWPVEIKLTASPGAGHVRALSRFRELAGPEAAAHGVLVCRVQRKTPLPHGHVALPWFQFPAWMKERLA